jgi:hypothetical protein
MVRGEVGVYRTLFFVGSVVWLQGCCCCGGIPDAVIPDDLGEMASQKGAELLIEQALGGEVDLQLDADGKRWAVTTTDGKLEMWAEPETAPAGFSTPVATGADVEAALAVNTNQDPTGRAEYLILEYAEGDREGVVAFYEAWAKDEGFDVETIDAERMAEQLAEAQKQLDSLQMPGDAMPTPEAGLSDDVHILLLKGDDRGGQIVLDEDGGMVLVVTGTSNPDEVLEGWMPG